MSGFSSNNSLLYQKTIRVNNATKSCVELVQKYELEHCKQWINENQYQTICLQFPDDMLGDSVAVADYLSNACNVKIYILADTSYGSCCVDYVSAAHVDAQCIIHFGPACLSPSVGISILYIYEKGELDVKKFIKCIAEIISPESTLLILYDTKFHCYYKVLQDAFSNMNEVIVSTIDNSESYGDSFQKLCGRVFKKKLMDKVAAVYIGAESMALTNIILQMPDVTWFNFDNNELQSCNFQRNRFLMKRLHLVERVKDAKVIGIIVATMAVENYHDAIERIKSLCKATGKKSYTLAVGRPNVAKLANFPEIDVFVLVACHENSLYLDNSDFYKPIVSFIELELALGGRPWKTEYSLDFRQILPKGDLYIKVDTPQVCLENDVSLVSGKLRHFEVSGSNYNKNEEAESSNGALLKSDMKVLEQSHAATFLSERSWGGLEQNIGETTVEKATVGRKGVPIGYDEEGMD